MGLGASPQRPQLVYKTPLPAAFLLFRLQAEPLGHGAHPSCAGHEHVLVTHPGARKPGGKRDARGGKRIPHCQHEGGGHGVPKERKRRYEEDTLAFIDDHLGGSSDKVDQRIS